MSILLNTKREYTVIPIIPIGPYFYIYTKTTLLITLLVKNITKKIFKQNEIQKENYNLKGEIKKYTNQTKTIKTKIKE